MIAFIILLSFSFFSPIQDIIDIKHIFSQLKNANANNRSFASMDRSQAQEGWGPRVCQTWMRGYNPGHTTESRSRWISRRIHGDSKVCIVEIHGIQREIFGIKYRHELEYIQKTLSLMSPQEITAIPRIAILDRLASSGGQSVPSLRNPNDVTTPGTEVIALNRRSLPKVALRTDVSERQQRRFENLRDRGELISQHLQRLPRGGSHTLFTINGEDHLNPPRAASATLLHEAGHFLNRNGVLISVGSSVSMGNWWAQRGPLYCPNCRTRDSQEGPPEFYKTLSRVRSEWSPGDNDLYCSEQCMNPLRTNDLVEELSEQDIRNILNDTRALRSRIQIQCSSSGLYIGEAPGDILSDDCTSLPDE